jgi:aquaporin Z
MAYVISDTFRCHLNPIVSIRLTVGGRIESSELPNYIFSQVLGAILAAGVLSLVASVKAGFDLGGKLASNGYGGHSPGVYSIGHRTQR